METLKVKVVGNIASYDLTQGKIVCDNDDYQIEFEFDEEWSEYSSKVGRFVTEDGYEDVPFYGTTCKAPPMRDVKYVFVGAYSAGNEKATTTGAKIPCERSILSLRKNPTPEYVMPDIEKVMAAADMVDGLVPQVVDHSYRIGNIEKSLDIYDPFTTLSSDETNQITVPTGASKYAKIAKIYGRYCESQMHSFYYRYELNVPTKITIDNGKVIEIPTFDSYHDEDYIFFAGGKAYFHKGTRWERYGITESDLQEGEEIIDMTNSDGGTLVKLAEPIITDISDRFDFDGLIDLTGATTITVEHMYNNEEELQAYVDANADDDADADCVYDCGGIVVDFEIA